ncbi:PREDICTED: uncharacterized protein LOC109184594 [Ipomoea nil]|uniref:uncharacterized protein LOC109184594 n=1 Tax=Ipomoea nil TaxID=35883 RepID=UPI000900FA98|nr:PREDICTED: uncharacterized protein LOC109184594 [Ipomoea nil]
MAEVHTVEGQSPGNGNRTGNAQEAELVAVPDPPDPMSTLSWNCRGLGNPRTVREVLDLASRVKGGLALLWRKNNTASLLSYSDNHVDIEVSVHGFSKWCMTGFYGLPQRTRRNESWEMLRSLAPRSNLPWVVIGDFNDLLYQHEKRRGNPHPDSLLRGFGETIEDRGLSQMAMQGYPFTWERGKEQWIGLRNGWIRYWSRMSGARLLQEGWAGKRGFRFENAWLYDEGCRNVVEEAWEEGRDRGIQNCIEYCGTRLSRWGGDRFHKFGEQIISLRKEQLRLKGRMDPVSLTEFQRLEELLSRIETQEDAFWRQRAKQHWLKGADANTKFFHRYASHRRKKNIVDKLMNDNGDWVEAALNETDVVLIPKKKTPERVSDLRPIALSNVIYRVMAKVITNRMKPMMDEIISDSQSAFIPDRHITDNILIAAEVGHYLNRKQCGAVGWAALKLDMAKAYDHMEWSFLRGMLLAMDFDNNWVELIMLCVSTVSYKFLINDSRTDPVTPTSGLRQGIHCLHTCLLSVQKGSPCYCSRHNQEAGVIKNCLTVYENLSGQAVNYHKSSICYSKNTSEGDRNTVAQELGVVQAPNFEKYLGPHLLLVGIERQLSLILRTRSRRGLVHGTRSFSFRLVLMEFRLGSRNSLESMG